MKHRELLELLATRLDSIPPNDFSTNLHGKDALAVAGRMEEFQKEGFTLETNDNGPDLPMHPKGMSVVKYKGLYDLDAASAFFDLLPTETQHLFSREEYDVYGYNQPSFFGDGKSFLRDQETPRWVAGRIRSFLDYKDKEVKKAS